jgi:hypothetical protein
MKVVVCEEVSSEYLYVGTRGYLQVAPRHAGEHFERHGGRGNGERRIPTRSGVHP